MEGVLGAAAVRHRVDQRVDHVEEVEQRARVGVREQQRRGVLVRRADVEEVEALAVDLGHEARVGVDPVPRRRASRTDFHLWTMSRR